MKTARIIYRNSPRAAWTLFLAWTVSMYTAFSVHSWAPLLIGLVFLVLIMLLIVADLWAKTVLRRRA